MSQAKNRKIILIVDCVVFLCCIGLDRFLKFLAIQKWKDHPNQPIIKGILEFTYLENQGAAFGLLKGQKSFFILVACIILAIILYAILRMPPKKHFFGAHVVLTLIAAGAVGNLIDRILYSFVVDYIYFSVIRFPIFNLADFFITAGTLILVLLLLFFYKEDDLNFLRFKEKKLREIH